MIFRRKPRTIDHPFFGRMTYMFGAYWECELVVPGVDEKVAVIVPAGDDGPDDRQVAFCRATVGDLDALFARCRPVFEGAFESWTSTPFPDDWRAHFALVGLGVPAGGEEREPWDVTYFVDSANHYFTAAFEDGVAVELTIDG